MRLAAFFQKYSRRNINIRAYCCFQWQEENHLSRSIGFSRDQQERLVTEIYKSAQPVLTRNFFAPLGTENMVSDTKQKEWGTNMDAAALLSQSVRRNLTERLASS
jgi:hypothetical protein